MMTNNIANKKMHVYYVAIHKNIIKNTLKHLKNM